MNMLHSTTALGLLSQVTAASSDFDIKNGGIDGAAFGDGARTGSFDLDSDRLRSLHGQITGNDSPNTEDIHSIIDEAVRKIDLLLLGDPNSASLWHMKGCLAAEPEHAIDCFMMAIRCGYDSWDELEDSISDLNLRHDIPENVEYMKSVLDSSSVFGHPDDTPTVETRDAQSALGTQSPLQRLEALWASPLPSAPLAEKVGRLGDLALRMLSSSSGIAARNLRGHPLGETALIELGRTFRDAAYHEKALEVSDIGLAFYPDSIELCGLKADSLRHLFRHEEALAIVNERIIELIKTGETASPGLYRIRGNIQGSLAESYRESEFPKCRQLRRKADESYRKAVSQGSWEGDSVADLIERADAALSLNTGEDCRTYYRIAHKASKAALKRAAGTPSEAAALVCRAEVITRTCSDGFPPLVMLRHPYATAVSLCRKAAEIDPASAAARHAQARYLRYLGYFGAALCNLRLKQAEEAYTSAIAINPLMPMPLSRRQEVREKLGIVDWWASAEELKLACEKTPVRNRDLDIEYAYALGRSVVNDCVPADRLPGVLRDFGLLTRALLLENDSYNLSSDTSLLWVVRAEVAERCGDPEHAAQCWMIANSYGDWYRGFARFDPERGFHSALEKLDGRGPGEAELKRLLNLDSSDGMGTGSQN